MVYSFKTRRKEGRGIMEIGIDMVSIERIRKSAENPSFLSKYFSSAEIEFFKTKKDPIESVAANFAGKEAFSKALGTGIRGFSLCEVSILRDSLGKPYIALSGQAKKLAEEKNLSFKISLSHEKNYAVAIVLGEETVL